MIKNCFGWLCDLYDKHPYKVTGFTFTWLSIVVIYVFNFNMWYFLPLILGWTLNDFWTLCDKVDSFCENKNIENKKEVLND